MIIPRFLYFVIFFFVFLLLISFTIGCGSYNYSNPIRSIQSKLKSEKEYSIILNDMKKGGNFFTRYYHKYRLEIGGNSQDKPFQEVLEPYYKKYRPYLGMVVASKLPDGKISSTPFPNGYQYVGNPQYGRWRTETNGTSFWEFYGKYMMISQVMNWAGHGLFRRDFNSYNSYSGAGRPYFGPRNEYGTRGAQTRKQNPTFFARKASQKARAQSRFTDRINRRVGRSKSTFRNRGFSFGK